MKLIILTYLLSLFVLSNLALDAQVKKPNIKILVLIIACDHLPVYTELQKLWRSYMHYDPEHIEAYFLKNNPYQEVECKIEGDTIWSQRWDTEIPGIINKTLLSMEILASRLHEFNYILRTNLSSFYVFDRLLNFLETSPRNHLYCGSDIGSCSTIASGCGFIITPDIYQMLVRSKNYFMNNETHSDDFLIGQFLNVNDVPLKHHERMDLMPLSAWELNKNNIPANIFHFRVKNEAHLRLKYDVLVYSELIKMFYKKG
ncbi:MAG: hypothetical protein P4L22_00475 [Candidatus Babeliales bacterium]|nr:hypothetical protein [Candidatus Babeliales bacterium]